MWIKVFAYLEAHGKTQFRSRDRVLMLDTGEIEGIYCPDLRSNDQGTGPIHPKYVLLMKSGNIIECSDPDGHLNILVMRLEHER